jgi:hypothetical protein
MEYEYKVVRTYEGGSNMDELKEAFRDGYEFVRASEFCEPLTINHNNIKRGYIEYILKKKK